MNKLKREFHTFDQDNPQIWKWIVQYTFQAIDAGRTTLSISLIIERVRWEVYVTTRSNDGFKISNNHRAYYARKIMRRYPQYKGYFNTRIVPGESLEYWEENYRRAKPKKKGRQ
jgi:hypothetical protein